MSVEFSNLYQEVLLENLDVILKQNFLFQTKLKMFEREANVRAEMQAKIDDLTVKYNQALEQVNLTEHFKVQAENNDAIVQEKIRIQSALNDTMKELSSVKADLESKINLLSGLNNTLTSKDEEIQKLKSENLDLKKLVPAPKVSKRNTVKNLELPVEISATEPKIKVEAGGTF